MKTLSCPNKACLLASARSIICYGFYNTNSEAPSQQVPEFREDILREHRHTLSSTSTSSHDLDVILPFVFVDRLHPPWIGHKNFVPIALQQRAHPR
jgi:hypothetical protein